MKATRGAVANVLKEEAFQRIESLRTRTSCPMSQFGVIKLTWDETPQRVSLTVADMEKFFSTGMWGRLEPRAQVEKP